MLGVAAFVFIFLVLLGACGVLAYRHTIGVVNKSLSAQRRQNRRSIKAVVAEHAEMKERIIALEALQKKAPQPFSMPNYRDNMENRIKEELKIITKQAGKKAERV